MDCAQEYEKKNVPFLHGTYFVCKQTIMKDGLRTMGRQHVHFTMKVPEDRKVISGMRTDCEVIVLVDYVR